MNNFSSKASLIWSIADLLRGSWKQYEYQDVILPLVVLKRLDCILADTKPKVLEQLNRFDGLLITPEQIGKVQMLKNNQPGPGEETTPQD